MEGWPLKSLRRSELDLPPSPYLSYMAAGRRTREEANPVMAYGETEQLHLPPKIDPMVISSSEGRRDQVRIQVKNLDRNYPHQPATDQDPHQPANRCEFQSSSLKQKRDPISIPAALHSFGRYNTSPIIEDQRSPTFSQIPSGQPQAYHQQPPGHQVHQFQRQDNKKSFKSQVLESLKDLPKIMGEMRSVTAEVAQLKAEITSSPSITIAEKIVQLKAKEESLSPPSSPQDSSEGRGNEEQLRDQISTSQVQSPTIISTQKHLEHFIKQVAGVFKLGTELAKWQRQQGGPCLQQGNVDDCSLSFRPRKLLPRPRPPPQPPPKPPPPKPPPPPPMKLPRSRPPPQRHPLSHLCSYHLIHRQSHRKIHYGHFDKQVVGFLLESSKKKQGEAPTRTSYTATQGTSIEGGFKTRAPLPCCLAAALPPRHRRGCGCVVEKKGSSECGEENFGLRSRDAIELKADDLMRAHFYFAQISSFHRRERETNEMLLSIYVSSIYNISTGPGWASKYSSPRSPCKIKEKIQTEIFSGRSKY